MKKQIAINTINEFPKEFDLEELIERLVFIDKVEKGIIEAKKGNTIPHEKLTERLAKKHTIIKKKNNSTQPNLDFTGGEWPLTTEDKIALSEHNRI